jgi:hypothetical protein
VRSTGALRAVDARPPAGSGVADDEHSPPAGLDVYLQLPRAAGDDGRARARAGVHLGRLRPGHEGDAPEGLPLVEERGAGLVVRRGPGLVDHEGARQRGPAAEDDGDGDELLEDVLERPGRTGHPLQVGERRPLARTYHSTPARS